VTAPPRRPQWLARQYRGGHGRVRLPSDLPGQTPTPVSKPRSHEQRPIVAARSDLAHATRSESRRRGELSPPKSYRRTRLVLCRYPTVRHRRTSACRVRDRDPFAPIPARCLSRSRTIARPDGSSSSHTNAAVPANQCPEEHRHHPPDVRLATMRQCAGRKPTIAALSGESCQCSPMRSPRHLR